MQTVVYRSPVEFRKHTEHQMITGLSAYGPARQEGNSYADGALDGAQLLTLQLARRVVCKVYKEMGQVFKHTKKASFPPSHDRNVRDTFPLLRSLRSLGGAGKSSRSEMAKQVPKLEFQREDAG